MATQTALALTEIGKPLSKITLPVPSSADLKENELLIKITFAGLTHIDQKQRDNNAFNIASRLPAILCGDLVGIVTAKGNGLDTSSFSIGDHVFSQAQYHTSLDGGLQEYTIINSIYTALVPPGISDVEAALYPINAMTTAVGLFSANGLNLPLPGQSNDFDYASQKLVIIGGGTNTGKLAIQFARIARIGTIIAIASLAGAKELKSYGATHVIARQDSNIEEQVRQIVGDDLLYVYDTMSAVDISLGASLLSHSKKGTIAHLLAGEVNGSILAQKKDGINVKRIQGFSYAIPEFGKLFWKELPGWLEKKLVTPLPFTVIEGFDADKINEALDKYRDGKGGARYLVRIQ